MKDDIKKVGLPASARRYARLTSKDKDGLGPGKVDLYIKAQGDLSHQSTKGFPRSNGKHALGQAVKGAKAGFPNVDGGGKVKHTFAEAVVDRLLGIAETRIVRSALLTHDGTKFLSEPGGAHIACVQQANQAGKTWDEEGLGFETDTGQFVTRDQAELIGLAAGQLKPEISDPGMIHAHDFQWESAVKPYHYEINCVSANGGDINDMVNQAQDLTYEQFFREVPLHCIFDSGLGYDYYWTPAQCVAAGVPYEEVARNRPLTLKKDWHVSYHRSVYQGRPCCYIQHSAIEYVFVRN